MRITKHRCLTCLELVMHDGDAWWQHCTSDLYLERHCIPESDGIWRLGPWCRIKPADNGLYRREHVCMWYTTLVYPIEEDVEGL
jgi:hypothetical protein